MPPGAKRATSERENLESPEGKQEHARPEQAQQQQQQLSPPQAVVGTRRHAQRTTETIRFAPSTSDTFVSCCVLLWYLLLPSLLRMGFAVFQCKRVGNAEYLLLDLETPCYEGDHVVYVGAVAIPMLMFHMAVVPAAIMLILKRSGEARLHNPGLMLRYGLLHSGCKFITEHFTLVSIYFFPSLLFVY